MESILDFLKKNDSDKIIDEKPNNSQVEDSMLVALNGNKSEFNIIFCIHGRGVKSDTLSFYEEEFKNLIGMRGVVLNTKCREINNITFDRGIAEQVVLLKNEMKSFIPSEIMKDKNNKKKKINLLIIGHSQGGVLAAELSKALDSSFRKLYNIKKVVVAIVTAPMKGINGNTEVLVELALLLSNLIKRVKDSLKLSLNDILPFVEFNTTVVDALKIEELLMQSLNNEQLPSKSTYPGCIDLSVEARAKCGFFTHKDATIYIRAKCNLIQFIQDVGLDFTIKANPVFEMAVAWFGKNIVTDAIGDVFSMISSVELEQIKKLHRRLIDDQDNDGMVPFFSQAPGVDDDVSAESFISSFDYDVSHQSVLIDATVPKKIYDFFLEKSK